MPDGAVLFSSAGTVYRWHEGVVSIFRPKTDATALALSPAGLLLIGLVDGRTIRVNPHGDTTELDEPLEPSDGAAGPYVTRGDALYRIERSER